MHFLTTAIRLFKYYKELGEAGMAQMTDSMLVAETEGDNNNSIVVIVKHLHGNMLSRWTNFLTEDGEKPWRQRDHEFLHERITRDQVMRLWEEGWQCLFRALDGMTESDLTKTVHIRGQASSAMDVIIRQLMHYSYHVGQIILLCKQQAGDAWQSLSIPKGESAAFNTAMSDPSDTNKQA